MHWSPATVQQGNTLLLRVEAAPDSRLRGEFDGQPVHFVAMGETWWALIGVPPWSALGSRPLTVEAVPPHGSSQQATAGVPVAMTNFLVQSIVLPPSRTKLLAPKTVAAEVERLRPVWKQVSLRPLWKGPFSMPAKGPMTAPYGARRSYNGSAPTGYHGGLDIGVATGTPIIAAADGIVALAEPLQVRGNAVILDHGLGVHSAYYHLSRIAVTVGQHIRRGQTLGYAGATGLATGAHLHWEIRIGEIFVNPLEWTQKVMGPVVRKG